MWSSACYYATKNITLTSWIYCIHTSQSIHPAIHLFPCLCNLNENISQIKKVKGLSYNQLSIIIFVHYERVIDAIRFLYPNVFFIHLNCRPLSLQLCKAIENKWTIMVEFLLHVQQRRPHSIANRCINWFDIKEEWNI